jgi:DedD protein
MGYQFSFTRLRLLLLLLVTLIVAVLLFAGGVAAGKRMVTASEGPVVASGTPLNTKQLTPAKPALKVPGIPALAIGQTPAQVQAPAATPAPAETAPPPTSAPVSAAPTTAPETASAAAPAPAIAAPVAIAVAVSNPADQPFVLQVGAFRETKSAKDLQSELLKKGYATTIYNMVDQDQRSWHMVRFGNYKDVATASKAASDFTGKESIQALVKRFDSL